VSVFRRATTLLTISVVATEFATTVILLPHLAEHAFIPQASPSLAFAVTGSNYNLAPVASPWDTEGSGSMTFS